MSGNENAETKRIGLGMVMLAWALALGLAWYFFDRYLQHADNPNKGVQVVSGQSGEELRLQRNRLGHYVLDGRINGHPVLLLVDTGATVVSIPYGLGMEIGLKPGAHGYANTANGLVETRSTRIDSLEVGPFLLSEVRAHMNKGMQGNEVLLGMSALKRFEIVQRDGEMIFRPLKR